MFVSIENQNSDVNIPSSDGIVPVSLFILNDRIANVEMAASSEGMVPCRSGKVFERQMVHDELSERNANNSRQDHVHHPTLAMAGDAQLCLWL